MEPRDSVVSELGEGESIAKKLKEMDEHPMDDGDLGLSFYHQALPQAGLSKYGVMGKTREEVHDAI